MNSPAAAEENLSQYFIVHQKNIYLGPLTESKILAAWMKISPWTAPTILIDKK